MTKHNVERRLNDLEADTRDDDVDVLWRDERTGDLVDADGAPADHDPDAMSVIVTETVVMERERAEQDNRAILGPADTPGGGDIVEVAGGTP